MFVERSENRDKKVQESFRENLLRGYRDASEALFGSRNSRDPMTFGFEDENAGKGVTLITFSNVTILTRKVDCCSLLFTILSAFCFVSL